ncbi:MAG: cation transporter [Cyanobacteria bacterium HKST-UBA04]|nr:cation transporter [Cyanobacteria bacterium HKST-UBA04]
MTAHHHCHHPDPSKSDHLQTLIKVLALTTLYMVVEFVGGFMANSLALIADAGHMLTDVGSLALAVFAAWFAQQPATPTKTYGYYRLEILAACLNGVFLVLISGYVVWEAIERIGHPEVVQGPLMLVVAIGGFLVNAVAAWLLHQGSHDNMNVRAAFLHVLSDLLGSVGAILAGFLIWQYQWYSADIVISIFIAAMILYNAVRLLLEATNVLLEGVPDHISITEVMHVLENIEEVCAVHDLHVWSITLGQEALSAHVVVNSREHYQPELVDRIQCKLQDHFGLNHCTIQLEVPGQHHYHDLTCAQQRPILEAHMNDARDEVPDGMVDGVALDNHPS